MSCTFIGCQKAQASFDSLMQHLGFLFLCMQMKNLASSTHFQVSNFELQVLNALTPLQVENELGMRLRPINKAFIDCVRTTLSQRLVKDGKIV